MRAWQLPQRVEVHLPSKAFLKGVAEMAAEAELPETVPMVPPEGDPWLTSYADLESPLEASTTIKEALPLAAKAIVALLGTTEDVSPRLRFDAAKYVLDRGLGKAGSEEGKGNPWDEYLDRLMGDVDVAVDGEGYQVVSGADDDPTFDGNLD
jgi:hypothetical protein